MANTYPDENTGAEKCVSTLGSREQTAREFLQNRARQATASAESSYKKLEMLESVYIDGTFALDMPVSKYQERFGLFEY